MDNGKISTRSTRKMLQTLESLFFEGFFFFFFLMQNLVLRSRAKRYETLTNSMTEFAHELLLYWKSRKSFCRRCFLTGALRNKTTDQRFSRNDKMEKKNEDAKRNMWAKNRETRSMRHTREGRVRSVVQLRSLLHAL